MYNPDLPITIQVDDEPPVTLLKPHPRVLRRLRQVLDITRAVASIRVLNGARVLRGMAFKPPSAPGQVEIQIIVDVNGDIEVSMLTLGSGRGEGGLTPLGR